MSAPPADVVVVAVVDVCVVVVVVAVVIGVDAAMMFGCRSTTTTMQAPARPQYGVCDDKHV